MNYSYDNCAKRLYHDRVELDKEVLEDTEKFAKLIIGQVSTKGRLSNLNFELKKLCAYLIQIKSTGFVFANVVEDVIHMKNDIKELVEAIYYEVQDFSYSLEENKNEDFTQKSKHLIQVIKSINFSWLHYYFFKLSVDSFLMNKSVSSDAYNSEEKQFIYVCVLHYIDNIVRLSILKEDKKSVTGVNIVKNTPVFTKVTGKTYDILNGVYRSEIEKNLYEQTLRFCIKMRKSLSLDNLDNPIPVLLVDLNDLVDDTFRYYDTSSVCISIINSIYGIDMCKPDKTDIKKSLTSNGALQLSLDGIWESLQKYRNKLLDITVDSKTVTRAKIIVLDNEIFKGVIYSWFNIDGSVHCIILNRGILNSIIVDGTDVVKVLTALILNGVAPEVKLTSIKEQDLVEKIVIPHM